MDGKHTTFVVADADVRTYRRDPRAADDRDMRKIFETAGFLLAALGLAGICREHIGWAPFRVVKRLVPVSDGALWVNIALIVVGALVMVTPDLVRDARR